MLNETYACRVCGLIQDEPPWGRDGTTATFDICDCCGVEFGYEDSTLAGVKRYREQWLAEGAEWHTPTAKPADWNLEQQLALVPAAWR
jgi:hypothetical protein